MNIRDSLPSIFLTILITMFVIPAFLWQMGSTTAQFILWASVRFIHSILFAIWWLLASILVFIINFALTPVRILVNAIDGAFEAMGEAVRVKNILPAWMFTGFETKQFIPKLLSLDVNWMEPPEDPFKLTEPIVEWMSGLWQDAEDFFGDAWEDIKENFEDLW